MKLVRFRTADGSSGAGILSGDGRGVEPFADGVRLTDVLHAADPAAAANERRTGSAVPLSSVNLLAPVDDQEVWAAGVTYKRSQVARMGESEAAADHYDRVYTADRPELFFKSVPSRVVPPGGAIRVRSDSDWTVPEPELALMLAPDGRVVGYTVGNDVSARDIEGENPLYLPQAKTYDGSCSLGPCVLLAREPLDPAATTIELTITRDGAEAFRDSTDFSQMRRTFAELAGWLTRDYTLHAGAVLLTGTGVVPPDGFSLEDGDAVRIDIAGVGVLENSVRRGERGA